MRLFANQRRRHGDDIGRHADQHAIIEAAAEDIQRALRRLAGARRQFHRANQADIANINHVRQALQRMHRILPIGFQRQRPARQILGTMQFQRGNRRRRRQGMAGIGIAMEEFDAGAGAGHDRIINLILHGNRAHGYGGVRQSLGHGHDIGHHAQALRTEIGAKPAKTRDDLIKNQQNAMLGADIAQPLEVADGRDQHAG